MEYLKYLLVIALLWPLALFKFNNVLPKKVSTLIELTPAIVFLAMTLISFFNEGPIEFTIWNYSTYLSLGLSLDILSGLIASTVTIIGAIVLRYSMRHLEDDPKALEFRKNISMTIFFVLVMLMSSNLALFILSWLGASSFLTRLLTYFDTREAAINASRQRTIVTRIGLAFDLAGLATVFILFKSLEFGTIFKIIENPLFVEQNILLINFSSAFIILGALTKSAVFPFHYWLPNTMEAPTPVSALMHAGIINAGGYLIIRMSPMLIHTPVLLTCLAVIGAFTAFWATIVMFTQPSIKKNLAYSTISQMGFMMLQCGLGAFSIAVVHLIGHAFYKAYAFLSSGSVTDFARLNRYFPQIKKSHSIITTIGIAAFSVFLVISLLILREHNFYKNPGDVVLLIILSLAASQIILNAKSLLKSIAFAASVIMLYLFLSIGMRVLLKDILPSELLFSETLGLVAILICSSFFVALYLIQNNLEKLSQTHLGKKIYVKALRGGFS